MTSLNLTELVKETELRTINFLSKLIPIKINDENPYNGTSHSCNDVDVILENLNYFNAWTSSQMIESLNYFKAKNNLQK
tara:strand:- start:78 stop:314 length:237 start_codon:yes stop_codon:yes gene_type:complete